jgi:O-antigen/teichoic acid export membrane protein
VFSGLTNIQFLRSSALARNTAWMIVGLGLRLVIQAAYFTVIARSLGAAQYGAFVGIVGLVGILSPFGTLGSGNLLVKNVARDHRKFAPNFGLALLTTISVSSILLVFVASVSRYFLPAAIPISLAMLVAASDLFGTSITVICGQAFTAFERLKWTASINALLSATRLGAAFILIALYPNPSALQWGRFYFGSTSLAAIVALGLVFVKLGPPEFSIARTTTEFREGFYFSAGMSTATIYNDIDKAMLARLGTLEATGIYGAAYRLIDVSFAPVASLLAAAYPGFFRAGASGISSAIRYAKPLLWRALAYASLVSAVMFVGAGIVPYILGSQYRLTVEALRWLAILPMLKVVHVFLSDALSGAGYQGLKSLIQLGVAVFNVLINLWIIPAYSWRGAAWSSIASDALLACGIGVAAVVLCRRSQVAPGDEAEGFRVRAEA